MDGGVNHFNVSWIVGSKGTVSINHVFWREGKAEAELCLPSKHPPPPIPIPLTRSTSLLTDMSVGLLYSHTNLCVVPISSKIDWWQLLHENGARSWTDHCRVHENGWKLAINKKSWGQWMKRTLSGYKSKCRLAVKRRGFFSFAQTPLFYP